MENYRKMISRHQDEIEQLRSNCDHSGIRKVTICDYCEKVLDDSSIIDDGYGSAWSAWCPECGEKTMCVVRPGKVQCNNCG